MKYLFFTVLLIALIFVAGCTSSFVKESEIQRTTTSLPFPATSGTQSAIISSTITQTTIRMVAALPSRQGDNIVITYMGGPDAILVSELQYGIDSADHQWKSPKIGDKVTLPGGASGKDHVIVVATFTNGARQIITDTYLAPSTIITTIITQDTSTITQTRPYLVAFGVQRNGNTIVITDLGGPDQDVLSELQYGIETADHQWKSPKIGDMVTLPGGTSGKDHVIGIGKFTNGVNQLLLDTYV